MDERPSDMYQDMKKLNMLYEEMCWDNDDIIEFYPDYDGCLLYTSPSPRDS